MTDRYGRLDPDALDRTVARLHDRVHARFPDRSLVLLVDEIRNVLGRVVRETRGRAAHDRPVLVATRLLAAAIGVVTAAVLALAMRDAVTSADELGAVEWLPVAESAINDVVFAGIAIYFLFSVPGRIRRGRTLALLHRLRSLAHVIDMHQLTKDPDRLVQSPPLTEMSPKQDLDAPDLGRYLEYCSEMLSLVSKTAALCAEEAEDPVVLDTISEIEVLTLGMSRKIWQKISLISRAGGFHDHEVAGA